jgi:hypothetical protein
MSPRSRARVIAIAAAIICASSGLLRLSPASVAWLLPVVQVLTFPGAFIAGRFLPMNRDPGWLPFWLTATSANLVIYSAVLWLLFGGWKRPRERKWERR